YFDKEQYAQAGQCYKQALQIRPGWEKAIQGLTKAQEALEATSGAEEETEAEGLPTAARPAAVPAPIDPRRMVDPDRHGVLLNALHKATIESDNHGRTFHQLICDEIEPVIKELSSCLISPDVTISVLDACIAKFEGALAHMRSARDNLQNSVRKVQALGEKLVSEAS